MERGDSTMINPWLIDLRQWLVIDTKIIPTTSPPAVMNYNPNRYIMFSATIGSPTD